MEGLLGAAGEETLIAVSRYTVNVNRESRSRINVDGEDLMMTHYCSLKNQPRMRASMPSEHAKRLAFSFVDASNLQTPRNLTCTHVFILARRK